MLQIPAQLTNRFTIYIGQQGISAGQHRYYNSKGYYRQY
jgi:hypothetical protein